MPGAKYLMKLHAREIERQPYSESDKQTNIQNGRQTYYTIKRKTACLPVLLYSQLFRFSFGHLENGCSSATGHVCGLSVVWPLRLPFIIHSAFSCSLICTWKPAVLWHIRVRSICTDCLIVRPLPADKRSCQLYLIQADGLVRQIEQCQRLQNRVSTSLVVVVYSLLEMGLLLLLMLMHMSRCIPICIFNNCQLSRTHREGACVASSCNLHTGTKSAIWIVVTFVCTTTSSFTQHPSAPPPPFPCQSIYLSVWRFLVSSAVWNLHKTLFFLPLQDAPKALNLHFDRSGQST